MKKLISLVLVLVMVFALASCEVSVSTEESESAKPADTAVDTKNGDETTEVPATETEAPLPDDVLFDAVPMPDVKADRIEFYPSDLGYKFFVFQVDAKYGTIGADGKVIAEPFLDSATYYYGENSKYLGEYVNGDYNDFRYIDKNGNIVKSEYYGWGIESFASVYWYNGAPLLFGSDVGAVKYSADAYCTYAHSRGVLGNQEFFFRPVTVAVKEVESYTVTDNDYSFTIDVKYKSDRYGLMDVLTGKMLTGFIFDDVFNDMTVCGAIAVKLGDSWAYANEQGEVFTDYKFTPADIIEQYDWSKADGSIIEVEQFYMPVNGYIVTRMDSGFGLIDSTGKTIVDNSYEFVSQVNPDGQFWILDDGVWSICTVK